mgnify:CR=1 FL=1
MLDPSLAPSKPLTLGCKATASGVWPKPRLDPQLADAHAALPWIVTFDDHEVVNDYAGDDELRLAVAQTVQSIANACCAIAEVIALGPLAGSLGQQGEQNADGDVQAELDIRANEIVLDELEDAPVSYLASEELEVPVPINEDAPLYVAIDPLDGSSNINYNIAVGTIFSVYRRITPNDGQPGTLADLLQQLVGADRIAWLLGGRMNGGGRVAVALGPL